MKQFFLCPVGEITANERETLIKVLPGYIPALKELDSFSHLNVFWWFSNHDSNDSRRTMEEQSPYKNSPETMGIFATRSPFRPNPIALTTVKILHVDHKNGIIHIPYIDAFDGTPVIDLKPYTPSLDRVEKPEVPKWCSHWPKSLEESSDFNWENEFNF